MNSNTNLNNYIDCTGQGNWFKERFESEYRQLCKFKLKQVLFYLYLKRIQFKYWLSRHN